jgi:hypothetical protein
LGTDLGASGAFSGIASSSTLGLQQFNDLQIFRQLMFFLTKITYNYYYKGRSSNRLRRAITADSIATLSV